MKPVDVRIFYPADPLGVVAGGIDTFLRGLLKWAPPQLRFSLVGMSADTQARPLGRWTRCSLGRRSFDFCPIVATKDASDRGRIPLSARYTWALQWAPNSLKTGFDVFDFHRAEPALLFGKDPRPKNLFIHGDPMVVRAAQSDIVWRHMPGVHEWMERRVFNSVDSAWSVCDSGVQTLKTRYPDKADRVRFISTWVDTDVFHPGNSAALRAELGRSLNLEPDNTRVVTVGRLEAGKDPHLMFSAFARLRQQGRKLDWLVVGDGSMRHELEQRAKAEGLANHIHFLGLRNATQVAGILGGSDLYAMTSAYEGMPMALLEAMGCGLPVASTDVGEIKRVVKPHVNGMLCQDRSEEAFTACLDHVIEHARQYRGEPVLAAVEAYHPAKVLARAYENYLRLAQGGTEGAALLKAPSSQGVGLTPTGPTGGLPQGPLPAQGEALPKGSSAHAPEPLPAAVPPRASPTPVAPLQARIETPVRPLSNLPSETAKKVVGGRGLVQAPAPTPPGNPIAPRMRRERDGWAASEPAPLWGGTDTQPADFDDLAVMDRPPIDEPKWDLRTQPVPFEHEVEWPVPVGRVEELAPDADDGRDYHLRQRVKVLDVDVDAISPARALQVIGDWGVQRRSRSVCFCNVHSVVTAGTQMRHATALALADMVTADGFPIAKALRKRGHPQQQRVDGPSMMLALCEEAQTRGIPVGLYGASEELLTSLTDKLARRFPNLNLAYIHAPPFRQLTTEEDEATVAAIEASKVGLLFVGLGCPKQEAWMAAHRGRVNAVMLGVGAAFDFHAGTMSRAPKWMRDHGWEWFHRLLSEPRRLWRRYLVTNSTYLFKLMLERKPRAQRMAAPPEAAPAAAERPMESTAHTAMKAAVQQAQAPEFAPVVSSPESMPMNPKIAPTHISDMLVRVDAALAHRSGRLIEFIASSEGEGVSTLAEAYAEMAANSMGRRVLLLTATDSDGPSTGVFGALSQGHEVGSATRRDPAGHDRGSLLGRQASDAQFALLARSAAWTQLRAAYDEVVLDMPSTAQSRIGLMVASQCDGVIVVVEAERTRAPVVEAMVKSLRAVRANLLGTVLNKRRYYLPESVYRRL